MQKLLTGYATRAPSREDAEAVVALIVACQLAATGEANMSLEELIDDWYGLDLAEEAVVVAAPDGKIADYADVLNRSYVTISLYGYVHPDYREQGIGSFLVGWGERWTRDRMTRAPENARVVAQHYVNAANSRAQRLLQAAGYAPVRGVYVMETELDVAPTVPRWPAGISVETFVPGRDERATYKAVEGPSGTCGGALAISSRASCSRRTATAGSQSNERGGQDLAQAKTPPEGLRAIYICCLTLRRRSDRSVVGNSVNGAFGLR